jgi:hypothetical protein
MLLATLFAATFCRAQDTITTVAGWTPINAPASSTAVGSPSGIALDPSGQIFFSGGYSVIFKLDTLGQVTVVAGDMVSGYSGDGGAAGNAQLNGPVEIGFDNSGNLLKPTRPTASSAKWTQAA